MTFWQLTIDANDPPRLAAFWSVALGYQSTPPAEPPSRWADHYRMRLGDEQAFDDRLFDPDGVRPPIWFQPVPETKAGKNRVHVDVYPTGRDASLSLHERVALVDAKVAELEALGAAVVHRFSELDDPEDPVYGVTLQDPEGNELCIAA